jgi:hypothetical protein
MDKYKNHRDNCSDDLDYINECKDGNELIQFLRELYPDIIVHICDKYSQHLKLFEKNWIHICTTMFRCTPQQIIIVQYIPVDHKDHNFSILNLIYSKLTKLGYVVRTNKELEVCVLCNNAILTLESCNKLKIKYANNCEFYTNSLSNRR